MSAKDGWKRYLLASGVPLEHEVAQTLVARGFFIESEFQYLRRAGTEEKEFSVDVLGRWFGSDPDTVPFTLNVLAECKYRSREKTILLFEDPNDDGHNATLGHTIAAVDACVPYHLNSDAIYAFESAFPFIYRAVEVHKGGGHDQDLRHGLSQLTYAAPALMTDEIAGAICQHPADRQAIFLTKLLVTNAAMRLVRSDVDVADVERADKLEDVSSPIEAAIMLSPIGPDINGHCRRSFKKLAEVPLLRAAQELEGDLRKLGKISPSYDVSLPKYLQSLWSGGYEKRAFITQSFIVTASGLGPLINQIQQVVEQSYQERTMEKESPLHTGSSKEGAAAESSP